MYCLVMQACPMLLLDEMCGVGVDDFMVIGDEDEDRKSVGKVLPQGGVSKKLGKELDQELVGLKHEKDLLDKQLEEVSAEAARLQV